MKSDPSPTKNAAPNSWSGVRRLALGFAAVAVVIALFYGVENLRGWREWSQEKALVRSAGTPVELVDLIPPTVPDGENFASSQPFIDAFDFRPRPEGGVHNTNLAKIYGWLDPSGLGANPSTPPYVSWIGDRKNVASDYLPLKAWQTHFRAPPKKGPALARINANRDLLGLPVFTEPLQSNTVPVFPLPPELGQPHEDILAALSIFEPRMAALAENARRRYSQFPIAYQDGPFALLPHLALLKNYTQLFTLRAVTRLHAGQTDAALGDVLTSLALAEAPKDEAFLISQLVRYANIGIALQPVWEGIVSHRWSASQLSEIQSRLGTIEFSPGFRRSLATERIMVGTIVQTIVSSAKGRRDMVEMFEGLDRTQEESVPAVRLDRETYLILAPRGWLYAGAAAISKDIRLLENATPQELLALQRSEGFDKPSDSWRYWLHRNYLGRKSDQGFVKSAFKSFRAQSQIRAAITACALERFQLETGAYPESLNQLRPKHLSAIPADPVDGKPLRYRRNSPDTFTLWSIGANAIDDGGRRDWKDDVLLHVLDWVWDWPPKRSE